MSRIDVARDILCRSINLAQLDAIYLLCYVEVKEVKSVQFGDPSGTFGTRPHLRVWWGMVGTDFDGDDGNRAELEALDMDRGKILLVLLLIAKLHCLGMIWFAMDQLALLHMIGSHNYTLATSYLQKL